MSNRTLRLYCLTYAGGSASWFRGLKKMLEDDGDVEVFPLEYRGRGSRSKEPFYQDFQELAEDMASRINASEAERWKNGDAVYLFGYSMGSVAAFEIVRQGLVRYPVTGLFLAAHLPPHRFHIEKNFAGMDDESLGRELEMFGGMDERLRKNRRFFHLYAEIIRNDYRILQQYSCDPPQADASGSGGILHIPLTLFYSPEDTPLPDLEEWAAWTDAGMSFHKMEGTHFFLCQCGEKTVGIMRSVFSHPQ